MDFGSGEIKKHLIQGAVGAAMVGGMYYQMTKAPEFDDLSEPEKKARQQKSAKSQIEILKNKRRRKLKKKSGIRKLNRSIASSVGIAATDDLNRREPSNDPYGNSGAAYNAATDSGQTNTYADVYQQTYDSTPSAPIYQESSAPSAPNPGDIPPPPIGGGGTVGGGSEVGGPAEAPEILDGDLVDPTPTVPSVLYVKTNSPDGSYNATSPAIVIEVKFFEPVVAPSDLVLELETGTVDRLVPLSGGSGTDTLTFTYQIINGEFTADLGYKTNKSLITSETVTSVDDGEPADLSLPLLGTPNSLDGSSDIAISDVTPATIQMIRSSTANATYGEDAVIDISVTFDEIIDVTGGTPDLTLDSGGVATYVGGTGSTVLDFQYTVASGHTSLDLEVTSFNLNGASVLDPSSNPSTTGVLPSFQNLMNMNNIRIDTTKPVINSINSVDVDTLPLKEGATLTFDVTFDKAVTVTGTPKLVFNTTKEASYVSGSGTSVLRFDYFINPGDDCGYPATAVTAFLNVASLNLTGASIKGALGNNVDLSLPVGNNLSDNKSFVIDTTDPVITNIDTLAGTDTTYGIGNLITLVVDFSENVYVTGTPSISLDSGGIANYVSGDGTSQLRFDYIVNLGDATADLDALSMTKGISVLDWANNDGNLSIPPNGGASDRLKENRTVVIDTIVPTITNIGLVSATDYNLGIGHPPPLGAPNPIQVIVTFSEPITITGTPTITLDTGPTVPMVSFGASTMTFDYTAAEGENSLDLNVTGITAGTSIVDTSAGNTANMTLPTTTNLKDNRNIVVDGTRPTIINIDSSTGDGFFTIGSDIFIEVTFSEVVNVVGPIRLDVNAGAGAWANYFSGTGTDTIRFRYTVVGGEGSSDLTVNSLDLNTGTIKDIFYNDAVLALPTAGSSNLLYENRDIVVDTGSPFITDITSPDPDGTYIAGQSITIEVNFNENISLAGGPPDLTLDTGATATFLGATGNTLSFNYTVGSGELSNDVNVVAFNLNGSVIEDASTNLAVTSLPANNLAVTKQIRIEGGIPTIVDINTSTPDGFYNELDPSIIINVRFSEPVFVTLALPTLPINVGPGRKAQYNGVGDGTDTLQFSYTIADGDNSADLDYTVTALEMNGALIRDDVGNDAIVTFPAAGTPGWLGADHAVVIDTLEPIDAPANPTFTLPVDGDGNDIQLTWTPFTDINGVVDHQIFLYTDSACNTPLGGFDAGKTLSATNNDNGILDGIANGTYWTRLKAFDIVGNETLTPCSADSIIVDFSPPVILEARSIVAPHPDTTTYYLGQNIDIETVWSEPVTVSGSSVCLELNLSGGQNACYFSGSGTNKIIFRHVVQAGDNSTDLSYTGPAAITLNGGFIRDIYDTNADLILPVPGLASSLSFIDNIVVDTKGPLVTQAYATLLDGVTPKPDNTYTDGETMSIIIEFDEPIAIGGTAPSIALNSEAIVDCIIHPSNSSALKCDYTVEPGNNSADLDYKDINSLSAGSFLQDPYFNDANRTLPVVGALNSISDNQDIVISSMAAFDGPVYGIAFSRQSPGKIYVVGEFTKYGLDISPGIARLNSNLTFDATFNVGTGFENYIVTDGNSGVRFVAEAIDGSGDVYVGGTFSTFNGVTHNRLIRLNDDGSHDAGFNIGTGMDDYVTKIIPINDGSGDVMVSGKFTEHNGAVIASNKIIRLNPDGSIDSSFDAGNLYGASLAETVEDFYFEDDVFSRMIVAATLAGKEATRLNIVGTEDTTFVAAPSPNSGMYAIAKGLEEHKKVAIFGDGDASSREKFVRYTSTGSIDGTVTTTGVLFDDTVLDAQEAIDGSKKYYAVGKFANVSGTGLNGVARINANGTLDATFNAEIGTGANDDVEVIAQDPGDSGRVFIGGKHTSFDGNVGRRYFSVLNTIAASTTPYVTSVNSSGGDITYDIGQNVPIEVNFSENITLAGGSAKLRMRLGNKVKDADCASVTGSALNCLFTVDVGDSNPDFEYASELSLYLPTGVTLTQAAAPNNPARLQLPYPGMANSLSQLRNVNVDGGLTFNGEVLAVAFANDGSGDVYVGGDFTEYHSTVVNGIVRLNSDLSIDTSFDPNNAGNIGFDGAVHDIQVAQDGSGIIVVGAFNNYQNATARKIIKLNHNGTRNVAFEGNRPNCDLSPLTPIRSVAEALDGSGNIYFAGKLQSCGGVLGTVWKLDNNGVMLGFPNMVTQGFTKLGGGADLEAYSVVIDPQGTEDLFIGFQGGSGLPGDTIRYVETSGTFDFKWVTRMTNDGTYVGALNGGEYADQPPMTLATSRSDDGELYLGSNFGIFTSTAVNPNTAKNFAAIDSSGNLSSSFFQNAPNFTIDGVGSYVKAIAAATDGSGDVYIGGKFTQFKGGAQAGILRANPDGTLDSIPQIGSGLDNASTDWVSAIDVAEDSSGLVAIGGSFSRFNGEVRSNIHILDPRVSTANPAPTIVRVYSPLGAGSVTSGPVDIYVEFSENVTITGTPYILLNLGGMAVQANYTGMLNGFTAIFQFTIAPGDNSSDLNYVNKYSLVNNGGDIYSTANNNKATTILPYMNGPNSLAGQENITVDTTATVINVTSTTADGIYKFGDTIVVTVQFDQVVVVNSGTPTLLMETGVTDTNANYVSGSGTDTLTFHYIVGADQYNTDLDYEGTNSLVGDIRNSISSAANLTLPAPGGANSLSANKNIDIYVRSFIRHLGAISGPDEGLDPSGDDVPALASGQVFDGTEHFYVIGHTTANLVESNGNVGTSRDIINLKFNRSGKLQWARQLGDVTVNTGLSGDASGDETIEGYCVSRYTNKIGIPFNSPSNYIETSSGGEDFVIAQYSTDGTMDWIKHYGTTTAPGAGVTDAAGNDTARGCAFDLLNNIIVSGQVDNRNYFSAPGGNLDAVLMKLTSAAGTHVGDFQYGSAQGASSAANDSYAALTFNVSTVKLYGVGEVSTPNSYLEGIGATGEDAIAFRLSADTMNVDWTKHYGQTTLGTAISNNEQVKGVVTDTAGNLYIVGYTAGNLGEVNAGSNDMFVMKVGTGGGAVSWIRQFGSLTLGGSAAGDDRAMAIDIDESTGQVYIFGHSTGNMAETNAGNTDFVMAAVDTTTGAVNWVKQLGNTSETNLTLNASGFEYASAVYVEPSTKSIYMIGRTSGAFKEANGGGEDIVIMKMKPDGTFNP
jgi:uncharacterized delta-60 repeat protein